jgi:hypothetical protein
VLNGSQVEEVESVVESWEELEAPCFRVQSSEKVAWKIMADFFAEIT